MHLKHILGYFLTWRLVLQVVLLFSLTSLNLQTNFLGGGISNYLRNPNIWAWGNFDGEHYLFIARSGYQALTYFYFPLYPMLMDILGGTGGHQGIFFVYSGLLISNISLVFVLWGLSRLIEIDYGKSVVSIAILLLLAFPTSFYFGALYTESLFLGLIVWSFYFARKGNWLWAGILGALATATRITGVALLPALLVEYFFQHYKKNNKIFVFSEVWKIFLVPLGLVCYMLYLHAKTGDFLAFFHNLNEVFGSQRSEHLVILPQVFYRYLFKILPNLDYNYWPVVFITYLEISVAVLFGLMILLGLLPRGIKNKKPIRESYLVYSVFTYLIPTLSGSFSSFPRYALVIFPAFITAAAFLEQSPKMVKYTVFAVQFICLMVSAALFFRGYWVS